MISARLACPMHVAAAQAVTARCFTRSAVPSRTCRTVPSAVARHAVPRHAVARHAVARCVASTSTSSVVAVSAVASLAVQQRCLSTWRLRPYAHSGTAGAKPLTALGAGFSKVSLSLMVMPWKALPTALVIAPMSMALPAAFRMVFSNASRNTTASLFSGFLYFVLGFMPMPCYENLFSELTWYACALFSTFFMYQFFPEVVLNDFIFMHYLALFTIPLIPIAFTYMPLMYGRAYFYL